MSNLKTVNCSESQNAQTYYVWKSLVVKSTLGMSEKDILEGLVGEQKEVFKISFWPQVSYIFGIVMTQAFRIDYPNYFLIN